MKKLIAFAIIALCSLSVLAQDNIATLRGETPIDQESAAPNMAKPMKDDVKRHRNYPMQPPVIPHNIQDYQVDLKVNKCLSCHARKRAEEAQAPMISVTHYMDRDGNFLADVSPRRYFCNQCHVSQTDARPLVENQFEDIDQILQNNAK
ncbi:MAG: nitrate reductase cytochrome c-type subunit [Pseudomonadota bacterium]|nr:nitrate reductase cytochrome c-type subunit [Pseudomonadota bacterium]